MHSKQENTEFENKRDESCCSSTTEVFHQYLSVIIGAIIIAAAVLMGADKIAGPVKTSPSNNQVTQGNTLPNTNNPAVNSQPPVVKPPATVADMSGVTIDDNLIKGEKNAPVTVINFSDFQCPFCKRWYDQVEQQMTADYINTGKVRFIFKTYAFLGPDSIVAAQGLWCANDQGKYWDYYNYLFTNQGEENSGWVNKENIKKLAKNISGLNVSKFSTCIDQETYKDKVTQELQEGQKIGVNGTPATFINGESVPGAQPYATFKEVIERKLKGQ